MNPISISNYSKSQTIVKGSSVGAAKTDEKRERLLFKEERSTFQAVVYRTGLGQHVQHLR